MEKQFGQRVSQAVAAQNGMLKFVPVCEGTQWKMSENGFVNTFRKGSLTVVWNMKEGKYEVSRETESGERRLLEKGKTPHQPLEKFLESVERTWNE